MSLLVTDCPRCQSAKITFDVYAQVYTGQTHGWKSHYELFCVCKDCSRPTIFLVAANEVQSAQMFAKQTGSLVAYTEGLNRYFEVVRYISIQDNQPISPPEHLPSEVKDIFVEGAKCLAIGCNNAAATMFRLCVDLATKPLLPSAENDAAPLPTRVQRDNLFHRLKWLFETGKLPLILHSLADCIREDGNDGAHVGNLEKEDAEDLLDFTTQLLEQLYTSPKKVELSNARRVERRQK